ncbi:MAG: hypothetical protein ACM35H_13060 [Bacteroidota bacterium]|nr:hypothetical protein [Kiloniellaceae bacterium]
MQALKALVIFMAVLIVAGMALLVYGLVTRTGDGGSQGLGGLLGADGAPAGLDLEVPDGCAIAGAELAGERLVLRLDGLAERDCRQVLVVDLAQGRLVARVRAVPPGAGTGSQ